MRAKLVRNMKTKIVVNENFELVQEVRQALAANDGYCPCKLFRIDDTKCICRDFREQELGQCHCGLYIKILEEK